MNILDHHENHKPSYNYLHALETRDASSGVQNLGTLDQDRPGIKKIAQPPYFSGGGDGLKAPNPEPPLFNRSREPKNKQASGRPRKVDLDPVDEKHGLPCSRSIDRLTVVRAFDARDEAIRIGRPLNALMTFKIDGIDEIPPHMRPKLWTKIVNQVAQYFRDHGEKLTHVTSREILPDDTHEHLHSAAHITDDLFHKLDAYLEKTFGYLSSGGRVAHLKRMPVGGWPSQNGQYWFSTVGYIVKQMSQQAAYVPPPKAGEKPKSALCRKPGGKIVGRHRVWWSDDLKQGVRPLPRKSRAKKARGKRVKKNLPLSSNQNIKAGTHDKKT